MRLREGVRLRGGLRALLVDERVRVSSSFFSKDSSFGFSKLSPARCGAGSTFGGESKVRPQPAEKLGGQDCHEHGHCSVLRAFFVRRVRPRALHASMGIL